MRLCWGIYVVVVYNVGIFVLRASGGTVVLGGCRFGVFPEVIEIFAILGIGVEVLGAFYLVRLLVFRLVLLFFILLLRFCLFFSSFFCGLSVSFERTLVEVCVVVWRLRVSCKSTEG